MENKTQTKPEKNVIDSRLKLTLFPKFEKVEKLAVGRQSLKGGLTVWLGFRHQLGKARTSRGSKVLVLPDGKRYSILLPAT